MTRTLDKTNDGWDAAISDKEGVEFIHSAHLEPALRDAELFERRSLYVGPYSTGDPRVVVN